MSAWYSDIHAGDMMGGFESGYGAHSMPETLVTEQPQYVQHQQPAVVAQQQQQAQAPPPQVAQLVQQQQQKTALVQQQQQANVPAVFQTPVGKPPQTTEQFYAAEEYDGYWEQLWQRRRDLAKLTILALVVLLALSLHSAAWYYLREFIDSREGLTFWKEVGIRVAYPIVVLLLLWHAKAFLVSKNNATAQ